MIHTLLLTAQLAAQSMPDPAFFSTKVYPTLEAAGCRSCHTRDGVASATRLQFPEKDAPPQAIQSFGLSLKPLGTLLIDKPTTRVPHTGGQRIAPDSIEEKQLEQWADSLNAASLQTLSALLAKLTTTKATTELPKVRRLTHSQYNNTVRDLLGDYSKPAQRFPPEDYVDGFRNQLRHQSIAPLLVEAYSASADKLATNAFRAGDINHLIPCTPTGPNDTACRDQFIRTFGLRAFRRPLTPTEQQRYAAAFTTQVQASGKFLEGARVVVEAMLQSPKFLFHSAIGQYGIATRISYLLWDTMPDKALLEAAANGQLLTPEAREKAARRLLAEPQAQQALDEFFNQWLRFDRILNASKERRRFPEFTPEMAAAMVEETRSLLRHLVWNKQNFMDLFTADYSFLSADLATLYAVNAPPREFELMRFPANTPRAGLLGHASFLAASAGPAETSPTARGIFVRENLLCQHVPPPPPNINTTLPEPTDAKPLTKRQRLSAHAENAACAGCHKLMDPIGYGLESFDALGRHRAKEQLFIDTTTNPNRPEHKTIDADLNTQGEIAGLPNSAFTDARQLGVILSKSPVCQECVVRQFFRYSFGRMETAEDQPTIRQLFTVFRDSGFQFQELLIAIVRTPEFVRGLHDNKAARN
ncbi:MAG: DUF1592 domain-containing protein [Bryobacterales bacterium]|nr:DUF1592 domain-containing protein [Bryobacterales bacterium]